MTNTEQQEIWKPYPEYPFIEANQFGEIRTKDRIVTDKRERKYHIKGRVLKQYLQKDGYMYVQFKVNGKQVHRSVHRIVATCFLPNPNNYPVVNHKDNSRVNNAISNLEWCSREYNEAYKKNFGTSQVQVQGRPVIAVNPDTSEVFWFESQHEAGRQLGVGNPLINMVVKEKLNKTHGYWFCYADKNAVENTRTKFGDDIANKVEKLMNEHFN